MRPARLRHLLILLAAIGLLPLALLGVWNIQAAGEHRVREQERALLDLARALASAVDAELDGTVATLAGMAHGDTLRSGDVHAFYELARRQVQAQPDWLGVVLSDAEGKPLFRTMAPYGAPPTPSADPDSLQQALALRRPVVGRIVRGPHGTAAVPVRVPVSDDAGRLYVLTAVIRPTRILRVVERQRAPAGSVIGILDASGLTVARSLNQAEAVAHPPSPTLARLIHNGGPENSGETTTLEGRPVITAYTTASRYAWTVAVGAPPATSPAGFASYGAGLLASLAVCVALASWLSGRIARRIEVLAADAVALGAGAQVQPQVSRIREIDAMGQALAAAARRRDAHEAERTRLLESLEQAVRSQEAALEQARQAGRAKDEFLAVLGHELRNPLSPIVSSLDLMDMRDEPSGRHERAIMRRQVSHLKRLVDDLLDVSRIASGKLQLELHPLDLTATVRHAVAALPGQSITLSAPDPVWVQGDDSRLAQVLGNLLSNAARFGSSATRIALTAADREARLTVDDNGAGIAPDHLPHIFEPFFQAPQSLARRTGGLGLGLAIVRKIVELHGGRIAASSPGPGLGSRFELTLPLAAPAAAPVPAAAADDSAQRRILVVDDNEDAAASTASLLQHMGHSTRIAHNAAQGLAVAAEFAPEIAILDIGLPDMDGYALAAILRARERAGTGTHAGAHALRLVALTGYGQQADIERAFRAGFDVHLSKPARADDLRNALTDAASSVA
jgi:signal transduction histidine kinase/ActR/RegA family two-component response regulator